MAQPQQHLVQAQPVVQQVNYQPQSGQPGYANTPIHSPQMTIPAQTSQMTMACGVWQSSQQAEWSFQQESAKLQQQMQILQSEYQNAMCQIRNLKLNKSAIEKKLEVELYRFNLLTKKYAEDVQNEQSKYNVLNAMQTETIKLLQSEKLKYKRLSEELEISKSDLCKEKRKNEVLKDLNSEVEKVLRSETLQRKKQIKEEAPVTEGETAIQKYEAARQIFSKESIAELTMNDLSHLECLAEEFVGNVASTSAPKGEEANGAQNCTKVTAGTADLNVPPGFERPSPASTASNAREGLIE